MAHEVNWNGKYHCVSGASGTARLGAACDFQIIGLESGGDSLCGSTYCLVEWILVQQLPFDSLYYCGSDSRSETLHERPIHISHSPKHKQSVTRDAAFQQIGR